MGLSARLCNHKRNTWSHACGFPIPCAHESIVSQSLFENATVRLGDRLQTWLMRAQTSFNLPRHGCSRDALIGTGRRRCRIYNDFFRMHLFPIGRRAGKREARDAACTRDSFRARMKAFRLLTSCSGPLQRWHLPLSHGWRYRFGHLDIGLCPRLGRQPALRGYVWALGFGDLPFAICRITVVGGRNHLPFGSGYHLRRFGKAHGPRWTQLRLGRCTMADKSYGK